MKRALAIIGAGLAIQIGINPETAKAAEGAVGFYLLGSKTSMAGFIPPPGTYVSDLSYYYSGSTNVDLEFAGLTLSGGVDADAYYNLPIGIWVAPGKVLGGNAAFTVMAPIGWKDVEAGATVAGPLGGAITGRIQDNDTAFGDPVVGAALGWHEGNWHWNAMKKALIFAAVAEAATGLALLSAPSLVAILVARVTGIALIGLGVACWPGPPLVGMLTYSALVTLYLAFIGIEGGVTGVLLWPAVVVHLILTVLLALAATSDRKTKLRLAD